MSPQDLDVLNVAVDDLTAAGFEMGQLWELLDRKLPYIGSVVTPKSIRKSNAPLARIISSHKGYDVTIFEELDGYLLVSFVRRRPK